MLNYGTSAPAIAVVAKAAVPEAAVPASVPLPRVYMGETYSPYRHAELNIPLDETCVKLSGSL